MTRFTRAPGVPFRFLSDEVILAPPRGDGFQSLAGTGAVVWGLLDESRTVNDLVEILASRYAAPRRLIKQDVIALLERLRACGSLKVVGGDA